jgi:hypothetical protein
MKIDKTGRDTLKSYFVKNAVPTASNFEDLVNAGLNQRDDGLAKLPGEPLSVQADGDDSSQKKLLNFYRNFNDAQPAWTLALSPRADPRNPATGRAGLGVTDGAGVPRLFIDQASGNLGVGTVAPEARLEVAGTLKIVTPFNTQRDAASGLQYGGALVLKGNAPQIDFIDTDHNDWAIHVNDNHMFFIREPWNFTDLVLDGNGNIGMGCHDPRAKLEVRGGAIMPSFGADLNAGIRWPSDAAGGGGDTAWIRNYSRGGEACTLEIGIANDSDDHISLMPSGNVGIGTRTPAAKLDVAGAIFAGNSDLYFTKTDHDHTGTGNAIGFAAIENARNYNALMILGRSTGTAGVGRRVQVWDFLQVNGQFVNNSDLRAKHDISELRYGLAEVLKLKPVAFRWNHMPAEGKTLGLIAQDLQGVIDEAVFVDTAGSPDSKLGIMYNSLIPVLVNAIKELSARLDALDGRAGAVPAA